MPQNVKHKPQTTDYHRQLAVAMPIALPVLRPPPFHHPRCARFLTLALQISSPLTYHTLTADTMPSLPTSNLLPPYTAEEGRKGAGKARPVNPRNRHFEDDMLVVGQRSGESTWGLTPAPIPSTGVGNLEQWLGTGIRKQEPHTERKVWRTS